MPLRPAPLALQFTGGLDTKTDHKQVPTTKLIDLQNCVFQKQSTLVKRNGYEALSRLIDGGSSEYGTPVGLANRLDELLLFTSSRCYSYRDSVDRWVDTGEVASVQVTEPPIARTGTAQTMPDHATHSGVTVVAWEDSRGGVYCSIVESASGRVLLADVQLDALGQSPRCMAVDSVLHVYWARPTSNYLMVAVVNPATPTATPTTAVLSADLSGTNPVFDTAYIGQTFDVNVIMTTPIVMAWAIDVGYRVAYIHSSGVIGSPVTLLPSAATWTDAITGPIAICMSSEINDAYIAVAWCDTQPHIRYLNPGTLTQSYGVVAASATTGTWNRITLEILPTIAAGIAYVWWAAELDGARDDLNIVECGSVYASNAVAPTVGTAARQLRGHGLVSRAFYDDGNIYAHVGHAVQFYPYVACVRISGDNFGGATVTPCYYRTYAGQYPGLPARKHLAYVQPVDPDVDARSRVHAVCVGYRIQLSATSGTAFSEDGIKLATLDFDAETAYQSTELGRGLYLASACQQHYDGRRWAEAGFHAAPDTAAGVTLVAQGAAGAIGAGTYNYILAYEEMDAQGEVHRGACSVPHAVTIAASHKVTVTIPTYRLTNKRRVRLSVFRSEVNTDAAYYRVTDTDPTVTGDNGYVVNDPTVDTVTFTDNITDAVLITRDPLYTNGDVLNDDPSPMRGDVIAGGKSRLFWTDPTDRYIVRYSHEIDDDAGVEMPVALSIPRDPFGGDIKAIGIMDGAVYPFCETAIYGFGGPGPERNPDASTDAFSPTELITSDVGCKSPNSICQSPLGIVFQSEKGIKLLDRSRQVQDIGRDVYAYNDQTITAATLLPDRHAIIFLTDSGYTLLWDYERQQWSKFTNHEGIDARVIGGTYYYLRTDGRVFRETPGLYRDDNAQIKMRIETAWIKFAQYLQGWQKVLWAYFLGEYKSAHTLEVRYRIDYNLGYSAPIDLDVNSNYDPSLYGGGSYGDGAYGGDGGDSARYQRAVHFNLPCQAISFRIEDSEATADAGASFELSELLLIGGMLESRYKPGPARTN